MTFASAPPKTGVQKFLDLGETVGNNLPHPAVPFFLLIGVVVVLSQVFHLLGISVPYQRINPQARQVFLPAGGSALTPSG
jgi:aminobenzoyl-glutamate transport protein